MQHNIININKSVPHRHDLIVASKHKIFTFADQNEPCRPRRQVSTQKVIEPHADRDLSRPRAMSFAMTAKVVAFTSA